MPVYYPQYHGEVTTPGPRSHMPAFIWRDPAAIHWQIFTLPVVVHKRYRARPALTAGVIDIDPTRATARHRGMPSTRGAAVRYTAPGAESATSGYGSGSGAYLGCGGSNRPGGPDL